MKSFPVKKATKKLIAMKFPLKAPEQSITTSFWIASE